MAFWGATVTSSKPFEESVPTNANLVVSHVTLAGPTDGITTLMCTVEGTDGDFVVAHLTWGRNEQATVDLVYPLGTDVKFTVKGKGEVHLLGMYDPTEMGDDFDSDDDMEGMMYGEDSDLEGEDDSDEQLRRQYGTGPKISELPEGASDEEDDDEEDSDEDQGAPVQVQQKKPQQQQGKQGGQQGQKQGGQQGQKQGGQQQKQGGQQGQKQGGQQQGQKQGGQQQGQKQGQKRQIPIQDISSQPQQKKQKTGQSPNNQQKRK